MVLTQYRINGKVLIAIKNKCDLVFGFDYFLTNWIHYYPNYLLKDYAWYPAEPILRWHTENETEISPEIIELINKNIQVMDKIGQIEEQGIILI